MAESRHKRTWLILAHQLPARPSNLRVRVWRRLQQVGAIVLRHSLYVLPSSEETREDLNWVREEIVSSGGEVSIFEGTSVDGYTERELIHQFHAARNAEYQALAADVRVLQARARTTRHGNTRGSFAREVRKLRERLDTIKARDYFDTPSRKMAEDALSALEIDNGHEPAQGKVTRKEVRGRTWVTRPRPGIDRMSSAWLIRRFIAPDARFAFATTDVSMNRSQIPFDMPGVEFGHHGADCTFETLMHRFALTDPAVMSVAHIVHDLDLKETRYAMPEGAAVGRIVEGLRAAHTDDHELLERGMTVIDALYRSFASDGRLRRGHRKTR